MRSRGFNHRFAFALPFGLACAHSGVWQYHPAATLSGLLPPLARDPVPRLPPASPSRCIDPEPASQPARMRVIRPCSPFAWRLVAHHRLARVRRLERALEVAVDAEPGEGERLLHSFVERAGGAGVAAVELARERSQLLERAGVVVERPRSAQPLLDRGPLALGQVVEHISLFVPMASLHRRLTEDVADRAAERLGTVDHEQDSLLGVEAALDQVGEQRGRHGRVLG